MGDFTWFLIFFVMEYNVPEYHLKVLQHHIHICYMNYYDSHLLKVLPPQQSRPAVLTVLFKYRWVSNDVHF